jgi:hypothetical protein
MSEAKRIRIGDQSPFTHADFQRLAGHIEHVAQELRTAGFLGWHKELMKISARLRG